MRGEEWHYQEGVKGPHPGESYYENSDRCVDPLTGLPGGGTFRCDAGRMSTLTLNGRVTGLAFTKRAAIIAVFRLGASTAGMFAGIF